MNVTTKFLLYTCKVTGAALWTAIIIRFRVIQVVGEILDELFTF